MSKEKMDAFARAGEMMAFPLKDLPEVVRSYHKHITERDGYWNLDLVYGVYAQCAQEIEGLPCRDSAYLSDEGSRAFFAAARALAPEKVVSCTPFSPYPRSVLASCQQG